MAEEWKSDKRYKLALGGKKGDLELGTSDWKEDSIEEKKWMCKNAWDGLKEAAALMWDRTTSVLLGYRREDGACEGSEGGGSKD